jgi:hypothetical protein
MADTGIPTSIYQSHTGKCEAFMSPILSYVLPAIGVCHIFPRDIIFALAKYFGLNMQHLYTMQEIIRLKDIISHTHNYTTTGQLYHTSCELMILEKGMETEVFSMPYVKIQVQATNSLIKSSLEFCSTYDLQLKHDISILVPEQGDKALMLLFYENNIPIQKLLSLN